MINQSTCECGILFTPKLASQKYCSQNCRNKFSVRRFRAKRQTFCACGAPKFISSLQCLNCFNNNVNDRHVHKSCTLKEYQDKLSVKGKHQSWKNSHIREFNRSWNKNLLKFPCANCGYDKHVELAHIKPLFSFPESATIGEVNDPNNIIQLCPNCHWEFDSGSLSLDHILKLKSTS